MKAEKKIGFFSSSKSWGGLEMNLARWASWVSESGREVVLFCVNGTPLHKRALELNLPTELVFPSRKYYDVKAGFKLAKIFKDNHVSQVVFRDNKDMSTLVLAKRFAKPKLKLIYYQGMQIGVSKKDFLHTIRFRMLDVWLTPLSKLKDEVVSNTKFYPERIHVAPLAVDSNFKVEKESVLIRKELGISTDTFVVGVIGRLDPGKCQYTVIEAFGDSLADKNAHLLVIGDETKNSNSNYKNKLSDLVNKLKIESKVTFLPNQNNIADYMNALNVFVMSSEAETFGMVTIEALWLGKLVVGTNSGGTPEILKQGEHGVLFEPHDSIRLSEILDNIFSDPSKYDDKSTSGKLQSRKIYSKEAFVNRLLEFIS